MFAVGEKPKGDLLLYLTHGGIKIKPLPNCQVPSGVSWDFSATEAGLRDSTLAHYMSFGAGATSKGATQFLREPTALPLHHSEQTVATFCFAQIQEPKLYPQGKELIFNC